MENQEMVKEKEIKGDSSANPVGEVEYGNSEKGAADLRILGDVLEEVTEKSLGGGCGVVDAGKDGADFGILGGGQGMNSWNPSNFSGNNEVGVVSREHGADAEGLFTGGKKNDGSVNCALKTEVIDGTAVIDVSQNSAQDSDGVNKKSVRNKESNAKERRSRRKARAARRGSEENENSPNFGGEGLKMAYTRKELESMRYFNVKGQKKMWQVVYHGFEDYLKREYDDLAIAKHHKNGRSSFDSAGRKNSYPGILGDTCSDNVSCNLEPWSSADYFCDDNGGDIAIGECSEDLESDDNYDSIQRPAFLVEGEPNFDAGPPEDGLEYLRRVRWEAAQTPKVKVAKFDRNKLKEQSFYMPQIPDIEKCPEHLLPSKEWEDSFLEDFTDLRTVLYELECASSTTDAEPVDVQSVFTRGRDSCRAQGNPVVGEVDAPTLSAVFGMDPVNRVVMLRRRISLFDSASDFSRNDCAWLFALCAVVDTPLDADTCAALRCLLRKCAKLRAVKCELDDEVVMLNILAAISGKYFGQLEKDACLSK